MAECSISSRNEENEKGQVLGENSDVDMQSVNLSFKHNLKDYYKIEKIVSSEKSTTILEKIKRPYLKKPSAIKRHEI